MTPLRSTKAAAALSLCLVFGFALQGCGSTAQSPVASELKPLLVELNQAYSPKELVRVIAIVDRELEPRYGYREIAEYLMRLIDEEPRLRESALALLSRYVNEQDFRAYRRSLPGQRQEVE